MNRHGRSFHIDEHSADFAAVFWHSDENGKKGGKMFFSIDKLRKKVYNIP